MQIGHKLKRIREVKKISQQEVAHYLNISQKTYSNIEADKSTPSLMQLSKLGEFLEFDMLELLKEQGVTFNQSNNEFKDNSGSYIINNFPEKLIDQYEDRLKVKQELILLLKEKIAQLENQLRPN
jgi:transcriptional regulator with XRE-family HTH domain